MENIGFICLFCWCLGAVLAVSSVFNWPLSHIRYLSESKTGKAASRLLVGAFGLVVIGIGALLWLAPNV